MIGLQTGRIVIVMEPQYTVDVQSILGILGYLKRKFEEGNEENL